MIYQKISEIMFELSDIGKIKREDIVPTMLPLLAKKKIAIKPSTITDYKFIENNASFIATYELVDTENIKEDGKLESIIVQLPAGGCDSEGKGRATYMASTGVYRQVLQQVFSIPILEPDENDNKNSEMPIQQDFSNDSETGFEEFEDDENENTQEEQTTKTIENMTYDDIDEQFENF